MRIEHELQVPSRADVLDVLAWIQAVASERGMWQERVSEMLREAEVWIRM